MLLSVSVSAARLEDMKRAGWGWGGDGEPPDAWTWCGAVLYSAVQRNDGNAHGH